MPTYKPNVILNESNEEKLEKGSQFNFFQKFKTSRFRKNYVFSKLLETLDPKEIENLESKSVKCCRIFKNL